MPPFLLHVMIVNFEKEIDKLHLIRTGKMKEGLRLGIPELDEHFRFKYTNFNVILGHANVGKTTVILYLMLLYTLKHDVKWLVFSSENEPYTIIRKLIEFLTGKPINKIPDKEMRENAAWIYDRFKFIDNNLLYSYKDLLKLATDVMKQWKFNGFMIDPYNSLIKDPNEDKNLNGHEYDYKACSNFRIFCRQFKCTIWLNTHANTEALRKKHGHNHIYSEHPIPPMASDVEGGGKFVNRADDFMVLHRYIQHPTDWMESHMHVRKVKDTDTGGRPTSIDDPVRLRSIKNNVGFEIGGVNPIGQEDFKIKELPF